MAELERLWPDDDRRDAAVERALLRTAGVRIQNRRRPDGVSVGRTYYRPEPARCGPTPRALRVVEAMSHGLTASEAATALGMSQHTVKTHLKRAARLMAAKNTTHLVVLCLRAGLIS